MKHYAYLLTIAIALIGCEKNGIDYDIVAGHTYVNETKYSADTFQFNTNGTCKHNSYDGFSYSQDENLVCVSVSSNEFIFLSYPHKIVLLPERGNYPSTTIYQRIK